jgi:lysyl-tRNA synthetase class 1
MYWADKVAKQIIDSGKFKPYWVDDMKTLSGYPTIGSLKGPVFHDLLYKALKHFGQEAKFTYIWNDFDPIDELSPEYKEKMSEYLGFPLRLAPSPVEGYKSFGEYFATDFKQVLDNLGIEAQYLSSWDLYNEGKFDEVIKIALDNAEKIQDIYESVAGSKKRELGWLPLQVICENCQKLGTTKVHNWDGETVAYTCEEDLVKWAKGCGNKGRVSPYGGRAKLPWKVDWPAHWKVLGITVEGAGKDHTSAGGSLDIARAICKKVFDYPEPFSPQYEFVLIGGKKMSTSKGLGFKAREADKLLPPQLIRFLFSRSDYNQQVNFDPIGTMAIPDLFDEYDRCFLAYLKKSDESMFRAFEMAQVNKMLENVEFLPRFRDVVNFIQLPNINILQKFEEIKGGKFSDGEKDILDERVKYANLWIENYAPEEFKMKMSKDISGLVSTLTLKQKEYLKKVSSLLENVEDEEKLQLDLYNLTKELDINVKEAFSAIYITMIGKQFGPKAAPFLLSYEREKVIERLKEAANED